MWTCCDHPGNGFKKDWVITLEIGSVFPLCHCTHLSTLTRSRWFAREPRGPAVVVWLNVPTCLTREVSRGSIRLRDSTIRARLIHTAPLDGENVLCTSRERKVIWDFPWVCQWEIILYLCWYFERNKKIKRKSQWAQDSPDKAISKYPKPQRLTKLSEISLHKWTADASSSLKTGRGYKDSFFLFYYSSASFTNFP